MDIKDLYVEFPVHGGHVRAVAGIDLTVSKGETLAIVGESGCGKTTVARTVLGLQPARSGSITLDGRSVKGVTPGQAATVGMVWQDPYASLDPRWKIKDSLAEPLWLSGQPSDVTGLLERVGLDSQMGDRYPHQLSGGQRQRAAIGRALALEPPLVICDEPTAALDLSMQAQILNLLRDLQKSVGCALLYISHDLTTVRFLADRVAVMYLGKIVEEGPTDQVFARPLHPYTQLLIDSAPDIEHLGKLPMAGKGETPDPRFPPSGCRFCNRCERALDPCADQDPPLVERDGHVASCFNPLG